MNWLVATGLVLAACGGRAPRAGSVTSQVGPPPATPAEEMLALLPAEPQLVIEVDLERLRANPVVGALVTRSLAADLVPLPDDASQPGAFDAARRGDAVLATADRVVMAAYGLGTDGAATLTIIDSKTPVTGSTPVGDHYYALGPAEWVRQVEARAGLVVASTPIAASVDLLTLRARAMPQGAPGASLRITARLSEDARRKLGDQIGIAHAPAQISIWADVVDDLAIVVDAEATEGTTGKAAKAAVTRLESMLKGALGAAAELPVSRALGLPSSLEHARIAQRGRWVRTIIAIGPAHLHRVVERATALLGAGPST